MKNDLPPFDLDQTILLDSSLNDCQGALLDLD